jgi:plastocyanin
MGIGRHAGSSRLGLAMLLLTALLAACGGTAAPSGTPVVGDLDITAKDLKFDQQQIQVPANRPFTIAFRDGESTPHNVSIYTDASASNKVFVGSIVSSSDIVYRVPALKPGTYFFRCDLHPAMSGSLVAR